MTSPLRICLTGGPCAGKTSVTELVQRQFSREFEVIPEAASILYKGGFPRARSAPAMKQVQGAIFHVQAASEAIARLGYVEKVKLGLRGFVCDRGTVDGAAYWPNDGTDFFATLGTSRETEYARYDHVIHMESATEAFGYAGSAQLRTETPLEALELDRRIQEAWSGHPNLVVVTSRHAFIEKVDEVVNILQKILTRGQ